MAVFTVSSDQSEYGPQQVDLDRCVHCGLCLNACPTYRELGLEMDSPRGRIYQMVQVAEGAPITKSYQEHISLCLACRGCETACPSGVQYGRLVEAARADIETRVRRGLLARLFREFVFRRLLPSRAALTVAGTLLYLYEACGLRMVVRGLGLLRMLGRLGNVERLAPAAEPPFFFSQIGRTFPAHESRRYRVAFLSGCINNVAFSHLNRATITALSQNGIEVHIPAAQGCCGALHAHAGFRDDARKLARKNIEVFLSGDYDAVITNAAGCGSHLKEYDDLLEHDPEFAARAKEFRAKAKDVTEYLAGIGLRPPKKKIALKVAYQDPCHLANAQRIRTQPRQLLTAIGCQLVELPHSDQCCGSAGVYNVVQNELSMKILAAKMDDVTSVSSDMIATANVGCLIQLRAGIEQRGLKLPVKHVVELLEEAYL